MMSQTTGQDNKKSTAGRGIHWVQTVVQDLHFGMRNLLKDRGYTFAAIIALALGIGANTALFTLFNGVVLRPLPIPEPNRVVDVYRSTQRLPYGPFSYAEYAFIRDHNKVFSGIAVNFAAHLNMSGISTETGASETISTTGVAEPVIALFVSGNYFSVMGIQPIMGRGLSPADDAATGPPYTMLISENFWQRRFQRDPSILGRTLMVSGIAGTVVGITPHDFMGTRPKVPDVWLPLSGQQDQQHRLQDRATLCCWIEARLKRGVNLRQARAEMSVLTDTFHHDYPDTDQRAGINMELATPFGTKHKVFQQLFYSILQPAIALILLIACANVAGLLLGRAAARVREIAVRQALGASRSRLIRQLLTEGVLIAQISGVISLFLTWWCLHAFVNALSSWTAGTGLSEGGTIFIDVRPDPRVFFYTFSLGLITGIAFSLLPAIQASKPDLTVALKEETTGFGGTKKVRFRGWMVGTQIAVCLMLLIGAGMLVKSSIHLLSLDPGFETKRVLDVTVLNPQEIGYSTSRTKEIHRMLQERLRSLPQVKSIASASRVPLGGNVTSTTVLPQSHEAVTDSRLISQAPQYPYTLVSPEFFETVGISLQQGRTFTQQEIEDRAQVAIVSEGLARHFWPGESALGKRITIGSQSQAHLQFQYAPFSESSEIVGVTRDIYSASMLTPDTGALYLPMPPIQWNRDVLMRTSGDPKAVAVSLPAEVQAIDRGLAVSSETLSSMMASEPFYIATRLSGIVFAVIGGLGLILASVGIYSMVGYSVAQQTREVGIRMALGAQRWDVLRLIMRATMMPIVFGTIVGMALGVVLSRVLSSVFQGMHLLDFTVLLGVSLLLTMIATIAAYFPAQKATKLDPAKTLRTE
ncbi:MAG TPA: ABC transporter permease [Candidatus Angelobacter sp.]|jgi:putative ABC transport system permease protein